MSAPLVVNVVGGAVWTRREATRDGLALYAPEKCGACPESVMATYAELEARGIAGSADALPMPAGPAPIGPQVPPFPPAPQTFEEKLRADVARLQGLLAEAVAEKHRALRERDEMRERVSEPYGCQNCGITKRSHGRRWTTGVGYHAWTAPTQEQIAERMKARRTVRLASRVKTLARLRDRVDEVERAYTFDTAELKRRVAELEAERHSTNEALSDAAERMRADRDRIAELESLTPARVQTCRVCGAGYTYGQRCTTCEFKARMASELQARGLDGEHYPLVHHDYLVSHDLPETGGAPVSTGLVEPNGCSRCGIPEREHFQRWKKPASGPGWHKWIAPSQVQIKARMLARRAARKQGA